MVVIHDAGGLHANRKSCVFFSKTSYRFANSCKGSFLPIASRSCAHILPTERRKTTLLRSPASPVPAQHYSLSASSSMSENRTRSPIIHDRNNLILQLPSPSLALHILLLCSRDLVMTRITNFGRKRTHVEATFDYNEADLKDPNAESSLGGSVDESPVAITNAEGIETTEDGHGADGQPPKRKRKRGPRKKAGTKVTTGTADGGEGGEKGEGDGEGVGKKSNETSKQKGKRGKGKSRTLQGLPPLPTPRVLKVYPNSLQSAKKLQKNDAAGE